MAEELFVLHLSKEELEIINNYRRTLPVGRRHISMVADLIAKESTAFKSENNVIPMTQL